MGNWLLVITFMSGFWGTGTPVINTAMHDFPTKGLCESAGRRVSETSGGYSATVSYECLQKSDDEWVGDK